MSIIADQLVALVGVKFALVDIISHSAGGDFISLIVAVFLSEQLKAV